MPSKKTKQPKQQSEPEKPDIIVSASGGVVNAVYCDEKLNVLVIDYDNIKEGEDFSPTCFFPSDGNARCKAALEEIAEAVALAKKNS